MRITLSLWLITAVLGIVMYLAWNTPVSADTGDTSTLPVSTEEAPLGTEEASQEEDDDDTPVSTEEASEPVAIEEARNADPATAEAPQPVTTPES